MKRWSRRKEYSIEEPLILGVLKKINRHRIIVANYDPTSIPEEYVYYKLRTAQFLDIGDTVTLPGIRPVLYVYLSTAYIRGSEFYFEAVVTPYGGLRQKPRYNRQLPGVTLEGYVIDVGGPDDDPLKDKVKVRINFDDPTPPEEAAWLPYATYYSAENHTGFYCLPEIGDYVKMRFSSTNEDKAVVVSSTRLKRDREKLVDHLNTKMFRTNHQKELALTQTGVTLSGKEKNLLIRLDQDKGVIISSHNQLEIRSKGNLNLQAGRKVSIIAKKAVDIKCGQKSRLVLNENETNGMIHIFGSKVSKEQGGMAVDGSVYRKVGETSKTTISECNNESTTPECYITAAPPSDVITANPYSLPKDKGNIMVNDKLYPIYVPDYYNGSNLNYIGDDWSIIEEKTKHFTLTTFDWLQAVADFECEELDSNEIPNMKIKDVQAFCMLSLIMGCLNAFANNTVKTFIKIEILKRGEEFRAVVQIGTSNALISSGVNSFYASDLATTNIIDYANRSRAQKFIKEYFSLTDDKTYDIKVLLDSQHNKDKYIGYLSTVNGKFILTPKLYKNDNAYLGTCLGRGFQPNIGWKNDLNLRFLMERSCVLTETKLDTLNKIINSNNVIFLSTPK